MDFRNILQKATQKGAEELLSQYNKRDFETFGNLRRSIKAQDTRIVAKRYIFNLINGQAPGKRVDGLKIVAWVRAKINPQTQDLKRIAFLISRKLYTSGSRIWRKEREPLRTDTTKEIVIKDFLANLRKEYKKLMHA